MATEIKAPIALSREKILETLHMTPKQRLIWLEEANEFVDKVRRGRKAHA